MSEEENFTRSRPKSISIESADLYVFLLLSTYPKIKNCCIRSDLTEGEGTPSLMKRPLSTRRRRQDSFAAIPAEGNPLVDTKAPALDSVELKIESLGECSLISLVQLDILIQKLKALP